MKCKKCGHRANSLQAMQKHYRKAHPGAMKRKRKVTAQSEPQESGSCVPRSSGARFCKWCGGRID